MAPGLMSSQRLSSATPTAPSRLAMRASVRDASQRTAASPDVSSALASRLLGGLVTGVVSLTLLASGASARMEGVNRPDLLPTGEKVAIIDVAGFLTPSEEKKIASEVASLERDTGFKLRVLAQNYPETPGLAIREYWGVDDSSIVFVADPTFKNILNFNVGQAVDLEVPRSFWSRLSGKYGNKFYWQENGEAKAILDAVSAIDTCLREEPGRGKCSAVQGELGEEASGGQFSKMFGM
ncbi:hypothetical protein FOA52_014517 [Chlamydomonas sp. UWO 241]|nr:hypothetical protein FOA52_014517 [Chlamydomonas sp. UWO 241]